MRQQHHPTADRDESEAGSATIEAAFAFATLTVVLLLALAAFALAIAKVHTVDAAAAGARLAGRGDESWRAVATKLAPAGATITATTSAETVEVTVIVHSPHRLPVTLRSRAIAAKEPGYD